MLICTSKYINSRGYVSTSLTKTSQWTSTIHEFVTKSNAIHKLADKSNTAHDRSNLRYKQWKVRVLYTNAEKN